MDFAYGICELPVHPHGSNRTCENLSTRNRRGTPYCSDRLVTTAIESIRPEIVEPSFAIVMKISPGVPSSYMPTVMYPSCPPIENLCVIDSRSSGNFRRLGRGVDSAVMLLLCFSTELN